MTSSCPVARTALERRDDAAGTTAGPGAGHDGDRVVLQGTPAEVVAARQTLTGEYLAAYVGVHS